MGNSSWHSRWIVVRELSPGGECCTFLVRRAGAASEETFVLKTLKDQKSPERRAIMAHEVAALHTLDHPGVARFVESNALKFDGDEELYLVREYIPGTDLETFTGTSPVPVPTAGALLRRVLDTLKFCHVRGVVHRAIKPSNVVLRDGRDDRPVLLDFCLTFNRDAAPTIDPETSRHIGDRFIYLPEDFTRGADRKTDVSDLTQCAGLLFYLVTHQYPETLIDDRGRKPHERDTAQRRLGRLDPPQRDTLVQLFDVAFADDPVRRWQSVDSLAAAIERVVNPDAPKVEDRLAGRARTIRQRLGGNPEVTRQQAADRLAKEVVSWVSDTMNAVNAELQDVLSVGLLLSRPKQGTKKLSMNFVFSHRHDSKRRLECGVSTVLENQELVLVAECLGRTGEVVRVGLFDPVAPEVLRSSLETFLLDTAEHFANGAACARAACLPILRRVSARFLPLPCTQGRGPG